MTTQTDEPVCGVMGCGLTSAEHGERKHKFSEEGILIPLDKKPPARRVSQENAGLAGIIMRLLAVLLKKGIIDEADVGLITTGSYSRPPSDTPDSDSGSEG